MQCGGGVRGAVGGGVRGAVWGWSVGCSVGVKSGVWLTSILSDIIGRESDAMKIL